MNEPIEEVYFNWLYSKVAAVENPTPSLTYYELLRTLHTTEFVWVVPGDDNRVQDGLDLRPEFLRAAYLKGDAQWESYPCSVLEMLYAFARRTEFETSNTAREWFWIFMENLGLRELNDAANRVSYRTSRVLDRFIWRTYRSDGRGGLFPVSMPEHDQTKVELWYQMAEYLVDQGVC